MRKIVESLNGNAKPLGIGLTVAVGTFLILLTTTHFAYRDRVMNEGARAGVQKERLDKLRAEFDTQKAKVDYYHDELSKWQASMDYKIGLLLKAHEINLREPVRPQSYTPDPSDMDSILRDLQRIGDPR